MRRILFGMALAWSSLLRIAPARADDDEPAKSIELTISARAIETPVMKYRLLPTEPQLHAGNAAPILLRMSWDETKYFATVVPTYGKWATMPLDDPQWKDSNGVLASNFYDEMKRAAFRRDAHWEYPIGEVSENGGILLPDIQGSHVFVRDGLVGKIRYHLSRGEVDQAREAILVGLAVFRHYARTPFLVCQLSASANARAMLECVDEMIGLEKSPNLYWALSALPRPFLNLFPSTELEQVVLELDIPSLADLDRPRSSAEWTKLCDALLENLQSYAGSGIGAKARDAINRAALLRFANSSRDQWAKDTPNAGAGMSDDESMLRAFMWLHVRQKQMSAGLFSLPPPEAIAALRQFDQQIRDEYRKLNMPEYSDQLLIMKNLETYVLAWSPQRKIDALRVVEAIRDYVAAHDRKLPEKLGDITAVSIPVDPLTGEPFGWTVKENVGRLTAEAIAGVKYSPAASLEYVLRVR